VDAQHPASESVHTFLFADLAGYTALTEIHGDEHAAAVVGDFCRGSARSWTATR
jgi:class 3 adenylate cyclase